MKYQIIPQDETVLVQLSEEGVNETLNMQEGPEETSLLVQSSRKDVLGEINLEKLLANLDNCVDLLQITFNAVDGFKVQSEVQELSNQFLDAMTKSNVAALDFKLGTASVLESYLNAYGCLFYGDVASAIALLADSKNVAVRMIKKADELVKVFDGLTIYTNKVLKEVMDERSADETKRNETKALIVELEGSVNAMEQLKQNLQKDIAQYEADYKKLQQREVVQEKRAYNMQMASMIINAVSGIFGVASSSQTTKEERDQAEQKMASETEKPTAEENAKRDYSNNIGKQEQKKAEIKKLDKRIQEIDIILDGKLYKDGENHASADSENADTNKTEEELLTEKTTRTEEKGKLSNELKQLEGQEKTLGNTLAGFGVALDKISTETRDAAHKCQEQAESLAARMDAIDIKRNELKDKERDNLVKLAEYTAKMKHMVMDENSLESAIQCLVIAVGCLRKVLAYLHEMKLFWENVEVFCANLAGDNGINKMIESHQDADPERNAVYFKTVLFVRGYAKMLAKWKALEVIFAEYLVALAKVSKRMTATLEQELSPDRKEQWKLASKLAGELNAKLGFEIDQADA